MLSLFKNAVYSESISDLDERFKIIMEENQFYTTNYPKFATYLENLFEIKRSWSLGYRKDSTLLTRGHNTNNIAESQFRIIKEWIMQRVKEYNVNALFSKLTKDLEDHYINKLLSISSSTNDLFVSPKFTGKKTKMGDIGFKKRSPNEAKHFWKWWSVEGKTYLLSQVLVRKVKHMSLICL